MIADSALSALPDEARSFEPNRQSRANRACSGAPSAAWAGLFPLHGPIDDPTPLVHGLAARATQGMADPNTRRVNKSLGVAWSAR